MSRLPRRDAIFFVCAFLAALLAFLPTRLLVESTGFPERGLAAREATGSIWSGTLQEAQWGPARLGDLHVRLSVPPLVFGRARLVFATEAKGSGASVFTSPWNFGFANVDVTVPTGNLLAPLPLTAFQFERASAIFDDERCVEAGGFVRAHASGALAGVQLPTSFSGTPRCENGLLLVPFASESGREAIDFRIDASGRYAAELVVRPSDPAAADRLQAAGFRRSSRGYAATMRGRF